MLEHSIISFKNTKNINKTEDISGDFVDMLYKTFTIPDEFEYEFIVVNEDTQFRPDIISKQVYGSTMYTDIICKLNNICNILDVGKGTILIIPIFNDISKFTTEDNILLNKSINDKSESVSQSSQQKNKKEPRKANQQLVGDSNFRINKDSKIIIY